MSGTRLIEGRRIFDGPDTPDPRKVKEGDIWYQTRPDDAPRPGDAPTPVDAGVPRRGRPRWTARRFDAVLRSATEKAQRTATTHNVTDKQIAANFPMFDGSDSMKVGAFQKLRQKRNRGDLP